MLTFIVENLMNLYMCVGSFWWFTSEYWRQLVSTHQANMVWRLSKGFLWTRSENLVNWECCMCGLKGSFEDHLAHLPSSLPHLIFFFFYTSRWKTSQLANETLPTDGKSSSSQSFPGASLALVPPRFYNTLQLRKVLLGNKNRLGKWVTSEKNPATGFLPLSRLDSLYCNRKWTKTPLSTACGMYSDSYKKIQRQAFLLESTRAGCWRLVHKDMDPQLSSALLFKQHHWWDLLLFQRGEMAILSLLLLLCIYGEMISCKTFGTMSSQTVPVVPTWWVLLTFIHRNIGTIYLVLKFKSL